MLPFELLALPRLPSKASSSSTKQPLPLPPPPTSTTASTSINTFHHHTNTPLTPSAACLQCYRHSPAASSGSTCTFASVAEYSSLSPSTFLLPHLPSRHILHDDIIEALLTSTSASPRSLTARPPPSHHFHLVSPLQRCTDAQRHRSSNIHIPRHHIFPPNPH